MTEVDYFSATMPEADRKFTEACKALGLKPRSFSHPLPDPQGEPLQTLVCRVGAADARDVLVIISGTHGIEGYCGAGIQTGLLSRLRNIPLPPSTAILMVHQINPWGCAWDRRENEGNVDIFRNLLYCDPPYTENRAYDALNGAICPSEWRGPIREAADRALAQYERAHGEGSVIAAARRGQHDHPKGLTYHGRGPTWSKRVMDEIVATELAQAKRVINYDIHTGYGSYGCGVVVCFEPEGTLTSRRLERWYGQNLLRPGSEPIIPAHPCSPYDTVCRSIAADVTSMALEFGTKEVAGLFDLLREMSWAFNYGDPTSPEGRDVRKRYRALFYPERDDWKQSVWARGRDVFDQSLKALSAPWIGDLAADAAR